MAVRRISKPPIIAPERAQRSQASKFHDQIQLAKKPPKEFRLATVSTDGGGRDLGLPSLYLGGNSAMRQSWSFAPVHHDVAAQVETQDRSADVDQDPVRDGWEQSILDEQQRQAQVAGAEPIEHEVEPGETLTGIAEEYGLTLEELAQDNPDYFETPRDPDLIYPGETIIIEDGNVEEAVDQAPVVQDGWEHTITSEEQRQAEAATEAADEELDSALAEFEAGIEDFNQEWAAEHEGVSVGEDGTLYLPPEQFDTLAAEWEQDLQNEYVEQVGDAYANYGEAVAQELRQAALEAGRQGQDPNQAVSEQADEIQERDTNGDWSADGTWQADEQDQTAVDAIDAAEEQVLGESQAVREAQLDYAKESQELESADDTLESAQNLPDNLADKSEAVTAAEAAAGEAAAEVDEAAAALEAAVAEQMEDLGQEVLVELAEQLGVTAPYADLYRPGELTDLSNEQLLELIQDALGQLNDPESVANVLDTLDEGFRNELAAALGVEPDELSAVLSEPGQLAEALGAEDDQAAIDALADQLIGMAAGDVSEAHGNNAYIDNLLFGSDDSPSVVDQVAVDLRVGELGSIIEEIDPDELGGVEKELWEAGDQVSVALLRQLGVSFFETQDVRPEGSGLNYGDECVYAVIDGERIRLSGAEEELLDADPAALALFLKAGFRLEGSSGSNAIGLAFEGVSYATLEDQVGSLERPELEELAEQLGVTAPIADVPGLQPPPFANLSDEDLRTLVLDQLEDADVLPDSLGPTLDDLVQKLVDDQGLDPALEQGFVEWLEESLTQAKGSPDMLAAIAGTLWWYGNDAESLAADAAVAGALRLQQTGEEVSALMAEGKDDEAQQLLTTNLDASLSEEERAILWDQVGLQHFGEDYWRAELDDLIADHEGQLSLDDWLWGIKDDISPEMAHIILGQVRDKVDLDSFDLDDSAFFSSLSAIVTVADQRADPTRSTSWAQGMAEWLLQPTENHPYGYQFGLGDLTNAIFEGAGSGLAEAYAARTKEEWQSAIEEAKQHPDALAEYTATQFAFFQANNHNIVPDYFDRIMAEPGIGEAQEVVYGDALRDLIANGMDLDWRNNEVDRQTVDHIMDEMFEAAGIDADERQTTPITVTVIPYIYAAERDGWATGALFAVDGPDEAVESTVEGGGYATTVSETDPHEFVIDGGVIANLASQADAKSTTIDAITKEQPWRFDSVKHFQDKNYLAEQGLLYLPYELGEQYGLEMDLFDPSADNNARVGTTAAAIETTGEKIWEAVDVAVTVASVAAMFIPIGGMFLSSGLRAMSVATARGILWASTVYTAGRGGAHLGEMRHLGIDTGWSNPMARSIYVEMLGSAAGSWSMAGSPLTHSLLKASGHGVASTAARAAYWSTQAGNAIDLATGAWLTHDAHNQLALAGEDATAWDKLMAAMGPALLTMGGLGMHLDGKAFNSHLNGDSQDQIQNTISEHEPSIPELFRNPRAPQTSTKVPSLRDMLEGYSSPRIVNQLGGEIPELDAAVLEKHGLEVSGITETGKKSRKPRPLNAKEASLWTLLVQLGVGNLGPFNIMDGLAAGWIANVRSAYSKLSWYSYNHAMIEVFEFAARGKEKQALQLLKRTVKFAPMWGAAPLSRNEIADLRASVRKIGQAGAEYLKAVEALRPELREALAKIEIRKLPAPEAVVEGWLSQHMQEVPEIAAVLTAMRKDRTGGYYGLDSQTILRLLSVKLDGLAPDELPSGILAKKLSTTLGARQAYRTLYQLLHEALPSKTDAKNANDEADGPALAHYLEAFSKLRSYKHKQSVIGVFELAAKGRTQEAETRLNKVIDGGPRRGAAQLTDDEANDLRAMVDIVGQAGADYRDAVKAVSPELREVMPRKINVHDAKRLAPEEMVQRWFSKELEDAPEIATMLKAMAEDEAGEYYGKDRQAILQKLSAKLDGLAPDAIRNEGILTQALSNPWEAYRSLDQHLREALPNRTHGKDVDHKAAEKYPGSSMAPATRLGYAMKMLSFGTALNIVLGFVTKGVPIGGAWYEWARFSADPLRAMPVVYVQWKYFEALRNLNEFLEAHPGPRTPEDEKEFLRLDGERKKWNTRADYTSLASAVSYFLLGFYYQKQGNLHLANLLYAQGLSSLAWVTVQQNPHQKIANKLGIDPEIVEKLEIHPKAKGAIRWSSISLGVLVPSVLWAYEELLAEEDEASRSSILDWAFEGVDALANEMTELFDGSGYLPAGPSGEPVVPPPRPPELAKPPIAPDPPEIPATLQLVVTGKDGLNLKTFVEMHPKGGQDENGRINPELDQLGYRWVEAKDGDSIRVIATRHSVDVAETVMLNMDHMLRPDLMYPGDRVYLPS